MHYIQKHILDELRVVGSMRYAQLNTDGIESGHFRYHLGQLVTDGYVQQLERGLYGLTSNGQQYVDTLSEHRVNAWAMPKVITYTLLVDSNTVLLQQKTKQPYRGLFNMIGGKLHHGETALAAAMREVHEKTNVHINAPKHVGIFEVQITGDNGLLTHAIAYVFVAQVSAADFDDSVVPAVAVTELNAMTDLAPDFMPIFTRIHDADAVCVESLELRL